MDESFKDAPVSLGERRAEAQQDCGLWTPREMLVSLLREIDSGEFSPDGMVVSYFIKEGSATRTGMRRAKVTIMEAVAVVEMAKHDLLGP